MAYIYVLTEEIKHQFLEEQFTLEFQFVTATMYKFKIKL